MAQSQSKNLLLNNLRRINKFAQQLIDARFYQRRKNSKKIYNRKKNEHI